MKKREVKIYCPKCEWEPQQASRWWCGPRAGGCGWSWNTFDTGGVCPECGKVWEETACLACHRMSPHRAWYHEFVTETSEVAEEAVADNFLPARERGPRVGADGRRGGSRRLFWTVRLSPCQSNRTR